MWFWQHNFDEELVAIRSIGERSIEEILKSCALPSFVDIRICKSRMTARQ